MKKRYILLLLLFIITISTLGAAIRIEYFPAQYFYFQAGTGALADLLVGHIGTIVFTNNKRCISHWGLHYYEI